MAHGLYRQEVFIKYHIALFDQGRFVKCSLYFQGGLYSKVVFKTGLTVENF